jgi:hypothetical protein
MKTPWPTRPDSASARIGERQAPAGPVPAPPAATGQAAPSPMSHAEILVHSFSLIV